MTLSLLLVFMSIIVNGIPCTCDSDGPQSSWTGNWCLLNQTPCEFKTGTKAPESWSWAYCKNGNGQVQVECEPCKCDSKGPQIDPRYTAIVGNWCTLDKTPCVMQTDKIAPATWSWIRCRDSNGQHQVECIFGRTPLNYRIINKENQPWLYNTLLPTRGKETSVGGGSDNDRPDNDDDDDFDKGGSDNDRPDKDDSDNDADNEDGDSSLFNVVGLQDFVLFGLALIGIYTLLLVTYQATQKLFTSSHQVVAELKEEA